MDDTFFDGHDKLYHHAKFGEDCTTRAGCRFENVVFVFLFLFFCHAPSAESHAFEGCIVRTRIALPFIGRFRRGLEFSAETVDVHLYKIFSARRYVALIAIVKFRIGGPKTARNVQVCAHQKSYRK